MQTNKCKQKNATNKCKQTNTTHTNATNKCKQTKATNKCKQNNQIQTYVNKYKQIQTNTKQIQNKYKTNK